MDTVMAMPGRSCCRGLGGGGGLAAAAAGRAQSSGDVLDSSTLVRQGGANLGYLPHNLSRRNEAMAQNSSESSFGGPGSVKFWANSTAGSGRNRKFCPGTEIRLSPVSNSAASSVSSSGRLGAASVSGRGSCSLEHDVVSPRLELHRYRGSSVNISSRQRRTKRMLNSEMRLLRIDHWARWCATRTDAQSLEEEEEATVTPRSTSSSSSSSKWEVSRSPTTVDEFSNGFEEGSDTSSSSSSGSQQQAGKGGVFPGGVRRAEVRIPGLVLRIQVLQVLEEGANAGGSEGGFLSALNSAVAEGLTMVILESGVEGEGGARLYEAACALKSVLRGRAELLVAERVDIAAAAGADGVLLSDDGLPTVVARRMMQGAISDGAVLPLVARNVKSAQSAKNATALEGADLLLLQCSDAEDLSRSVGTVCKEVSIPVFVDGSGLGLSLKKEANSNGVSEAQRSIHAGASGIVLRGGTEVIDSNDISSQVASLLSTLSRAMQERQQSKATELQTAVGKEEEEEPSPSASAGFFGLQTPPGLQSIIDKVPKLALDLDEKAKLIVEDERKLLTAMIDLVQAASPEMQEISLLIDALKQLDELFLLVIVGEFNSGKSSVINALLGKRFLKEGVLPTTNEITLIRHSKEGFEGEERSERHPDGHFLRYIPAELLKQMNLVDTPGTNVILQRQQRLTEEFVPRADLVLFVLSVDRALTESEVTFLRYIRQWGKKIIFILNKSDSLSNRDELEDVISFVKENAQSLLGVEQILVYPVSARRAILAKQAATNSDGVVDKDVLSQDSYWKGSGFAELEEYIYDFLEGTSDAGAERLRLKLDTPLGIGVALLGASDRQLSTDLVKADTDLKVLDQIEDQIRQYQEIIQSDAAMQRQRATELITGAKDRAGMFVDSLIRLSNVEAVVQYLFGSEGTSSLPVSRAFDKRVVGSTVSDVRKLLEEQRAWLMSSISRQISKYGEIVRSRWPAVPTNLKAGNTLVPNGLDPAFLQESLVAKQDTGYNTPSESLAVLDGFDVRAAELLLEQEVREVVLGTYGRLGIAGVAGYVLTSVLPNTVDDLLALAVCTAGGFLGVWNLPSRRQGVKRKVDKVADGIARQLTQAMQTDLQQKLDQLVDDMKALTTSYRTAAEAERTRVVGLQKRLAELDSDLRVIRQKVQNLGT